MIIGKIGKEETNCFAGIAVRNRLARYLTYYRKYL